MKPFRSESLTPFETYVYGLKARAHFHHCLGNGVFPVELTRLTAVRKRYSKQVQPATLMPFFIKAVALSVRAIPSGNSILFRRFPFGRRIVRFDVVDVSVPIARTVDGESVVFIGVVRGADKLTIAEIQGELEHMQRCPPTESPYIDKVRKLKRAPAFVASLYHWLMTRSPSFYLKNTGTCGITTLGGMAGGHFFPIGPTTAVFGIGGVGDEVVARDGVPVVRRMLHAALTVDNYVVTGPDGIALARTFQELIESCSFVDSELAEEPPGRSAAAAVRDRASR